MSPYLNFDGKTEEAFNFYKSVFGGEFATFQRFGEMPQDSPGFNEMSESGKKRVLHVALPLGDGNILMGSDSPENFRDMRIGNNFHISISADSKEEAARIFDALSAGGKAYMPLADAFWGAYFGMCADKFGVNWMVSYEYPK